MDSWQMETFFMTSTLCGGAARTTGRPGAMLPDQFEHASACHSVHAPTRNQATATRRER